MKVILKFILIFVSIFIIACSTKMSDNFKKSQPILSHIDSIKLLMSTHAATIIDVRTLNEFQNGHIEGSINIPLKEIEESIEKFKQYQNIVVVCRSGKRSGKAKEILNNHGFTNVYNGLSWDSLNEILNE